MGTGPPHARVGISAVPQPTPELKGLYPLAQHLPPGRSACAELGVGLLEPPLQTVPRRPGRYAPALPAKWACRAGARERAGPRQKRLRCAISGSTTGPLASHAAAGASPRLEPEQR